MLIITQKLSIIKEFFGCAGCYQLSVFIRLGCQIAIRRSLLQRKEHYQKVTITQQLKVSAILKNLLTKPFVSDTIILSVLLRISTPFSYC